MREARRRDLVILLGTAALICTSAGRAEQSGDKLPKIGLLLNIPSENSDALLQGLRSLGYADGQNVLIEKRFHGMSLDRLDKFAQELVARQCSVIFAADPYAIEAVLRVTKTIPIIGVDLETDPVANGWAQSLAHPGGNLTGLFLDIPELGGKLVEFARDAVPTLSHLAVLWDNTIADAQFRATQAAVSHIAGLTLRSLPIRQMDEIEGALDRAAREQTQGVIVLSSPLFYKQRSQIAELALNKRLPAISLFTSFPKWGGLLAYGPNLAAMFMQAAEYIGRVLAGTNPSDLPIQRPAKFELIINLKTANTFGLAVPQSLLARADEVIE